MAILVGVVIVCIAVTIFFAVPKKLSVFDMIFLFFADTIMELGTISPLQVNFKVMTVNPDVESALGDLMYRLIELPLLLVVTSNLLLSEHRWLKWCGTMGVVLLTLVVQWFLVWHGMLVFHHWHLLYSAAYMCVFVGFSRAMTWFVQIPSKKVNVEHGRS